MEAVNFNSLLPTKIDSSRDKPSVNAYENLFAFAFCAASTFLCCAPILLCVVELFGPRQITVDPARFEVFLSKTSHGLSHFAVELRLFLPKLPEDFC